MPVTVDIRHDLAGLQARLGLLAQERMQAAVRAINRTMTTVRADASRRLRPHYAGLPAARVKRHMRFTRATRGVPAATLTFSAARIRVVQWHVRQGAAGLTGRLPYRLETGEGEPVTAAMLRHGFLRTAKSSGRFNAWLRAGKQRYPIVTIVAPSLASAVVELHILDPLARVARERFGVVFAQEAKFRLSKRG